MACAVSLRWEGDAPQSSIGYPLECRIYNVSPDRNKYPKPRLVDVAAEWRRAIQGTRADLDLKATRLRWRAKEQAGRATRRDC